MLHLSRLDTRGVSRSSRNVRRDVVDVEGADRRAALFADGEVVWSWRPKVLALSPSEAEKLRGGDGGKRDGSPRRVRISRKPLRGEGRSVSACTCGHARLRRVFCAAAPGAAATRPSLRPCSSEGDRISELGRIMPRERGCMLIIVRHSAMRDRSRGLGASPDRHHLQPPPGRRTDRVGPGSGVKWKCSRVRWVRFCPLGIGCGSL